ncbi:preprotein translocase subunit SecD [Friedmanniella endophytica]|uniref:Protein translocase subunit SecD n=1 Tax=Microlunatus kandeliicorticis TaxID=1759536 RepID=A0A7W3P6N3_9ACTN|nr:preprotein translocase subunit SecD [Microlunatus kandeliicorticis]
MILAGLYGLMAFTKSWTPKLGLDLRGGTTVTLTATNTTGRGGVDPTSLRQAQTIIQQRVDGLGVGESEVSTSGDNQIIVSVPNVQQDQLVATVGQTALLRFRMVYAEEQVAAPSGGGQVPSGVPSTEAGSGSSAAAEPSSGASSEPSSEPSASKTGNGRPLPLLPTAPPEPPATPLPTAEGKGTPQDKAVDWQPSATDQANFQSFSCDPNVRQYYPDVSDQPLFTCDESNTTKYLLGPTVIEGKEVTSATAGVPQGQVGWEVQLNFNGQGTDQFAKVTALLNSKQSPENQFAIVLDGKVVSAPQVTQGAITGGQASISGNFTQQSAQSLANVLKYGALPLAFEVSSVDNVSATLGAEQLRAGIVAGIIGLILVVGFCFLYYRGLGIVVVSSLAVAAALTYACMVLLGSSVGFALSLPGIAGAIVAIGVTADSFVIYFERIRDEVREGRSLRTAVETGWRRARQTVLIADAVSMLSAIILFILAIGAVKGFAFTLGLTTLIDVVVVFFFTKPLMSLLSRTSFFGNGHKLSGLDPAHLGVKRLPGARGRVRGSAAPAADVATAGGDA